jgi:hypothetical protein
MSLKLAGHLFTGPFPIETTEVRDNQVPVVYAVIAKGGPPWAPVFRIVDVQASPDSGIRFGDHPGRRGWIAQAGESIGIYLFYAPHSQYTSVDRERLAGELRQRYGPPSGLVD